MFALLESSAGGLLPNILSFFFCIVLVPEQHLLSHANRCCLDILSEV